MQAQILLLIINALFICEAARSKYNDEENDNPYEFGFTIDGQQHRHEKKDANGIIQGEFGFITADGVYHVTVYATDENGNFKILSMRNVKISGPLDEPGAKLPDTSQFSKGVPAQKVQDAPTVPKASPNPLSLTTVRAEIKFTTQPTIKPACAGCGYVTQGPKGGKLPFQTQAFNNPKPGSVVIGKIEDKKDFTSPPKLSNPSPIVPQQLENRNKFDESHDNPPQSIDHNFNNNPPNTNIPPSKFFNNNNLSEVTTPQTGLVNYNNPIIPPTSSSDNFNPPISTNYNLNPPPSTNNNFNSQTPTNNFNQPPPTGNNFNPPPSTNNNFNQPTLTNNFNPPPSYNSNYNPSETPINDYNPPLNNNAPTVLSNNQPLSNQNNVPVSPVSPINLNKQFQPNPALDKSQPLELSVPPSSSGITVENGVIKVPNNPPIKIQDKYPNMVDGLPAGIGTEDITDLLYKFNYTVGFHGHYEKGYKNGAKVGGYFVTDRDGVSRVVTYVADENGYRPKVSFIRLDLNSDLVPKEGTEKTFGLKNFEFTWYPLK